MLSNPRFSSVDLLWVALVLFIVLAVAILLPIYPNDYWWYVRIGGDTVRAGAIPRVDALSSTQAGQPVVYHAWLAAVAFWKLHAVGGPAATALARGLLLGAFTLWIWLACREAGAGPQLAGGLALLAALAGSGNWVVRPQLFAYPLFGVSLWVLWRWQQGKPGPLWLLPLAALFWVNLHGSFVLPFLLAGAALVGGGGDRRRLAYALAGMVLASLANPRGLGAWEYALSLWSNPAVRQFSSEWQPPANAGWQASLFFGWLLAFPLLAARSPRRLALTHWLWFLGLGWMALSSVRNGIWFLAALAPLSAWLAAPLLEARPASTPARVRPALNGLLGLSLLLLPLAGLPGARERWWQAPPPTLSASTPVAAAAWLAERPELPGPLWAEIGFASYLEYALPERPVWIDTRFEVYPVAQWERYQAISEAAPNWQAELEAAGIVLVMASAETQPRLLEALQGSRLWCERYRDAAAAIFSRRSAGRECP
jgi:hypothetical protein